MSRKGRAGYLHGVADWLREHEAEVIDLVIAEAGATINLCRGPQVGFMPGQIDFVTDCAVAEGDTIAVAPKIGINTGNRMVVKEPVGVAGLITAWNFPLFLDAFKMTSALAAGCTAVLKPSPLTPHTALLFGRAAEAVGLPEGVLNIVTGKANELGAQLVVSPLVDMISFTGSAATGRAIQAASGPTLKRLTLELGGKSALIVLDDASPEMVAKVAVGGVCGHAGQVCVSLSRALVPRRMYPAFLDAVKAAAADVKVGDPHDPSVTFGPLISAGQRERVEGYIRSGIEQGATLLVGGDRPAHLSKGYYLNLTIFSDVRNDMRIAQEEIFGPVLCIIPYDGGDDEAVAIANDSPYGLSGGVWTGSVTRGLSVARRIRTGMINVNGGGGMGASPEIDTPGGGFKQSGHGREFGRWGLAEFEELKAVSWPSY
jgi:acyl-CoA reductase-like NAD-dependent aldehyde dehydrogenase